MSKLFLCSILVVIFSATVCALPGTTSEYRKYLRTRPPRAPGEVHVEEVLEVFSGPNRPPTYGVYNEQVNAFLARNALQHHQRQKASLRMLVTGRPAHPLQRTTYPTPTGENVNPDYTFPFQPSISITKYPSYVPPRTIIIQEGSTDPKATTGGVDGEEADMIDGDNEPLDPMDDYSYSNEDFFEQ